VEAIILVGGRGTRLRPLTCTTPKPMLPVAGVPFVTHQLARARDAGVDHVVLATSYRAEAFAAHFGDGTAMGLSIDYATETEPLGTAGGIRNVAHLLRSDPGDPVLVFNGDVLSGHDVTAQLAMHRDGDAAVTLHLVEVGDPRAFGCVPTDATGRVAAFLEKPSEPVTSQVNAGCYVFRREVIDAIPADRRVSVERETFPGLLAGGAAVLGYVESSYWLDVGTPDAFVRGSADLVRGALASSALPGPPGEALVLDDAELAASAALSGGSCAGPGAIVGDGAQVDGSVLLDGAIVASGATVRRSALGRGARVGAETVVEDAVLGDGADAGEGNELAHGLRLWPGATLTDRSLRFSPET
jgi:mannose-1-phosphate guanylyltransferase